MRYLPSTGNQLVLQVPEDKNSYINVKNFNARGVSKIFEGQISNAVASGNENQLTFSQITDGEGLTLDQYRSVLSQDIELQAFIYRNVTVGSTPDASIISVSSYNLEGIDFSDQVTGSNDTLGQLKYYIFGYNLNTGQMPYAVSVIGDSPAHIGVLDPSKWNKNQYAEITFSRSSSNVLPVIYRYWNGNLDFLGVIGNNKIGNSGVLSFKDYGNRQIPSWNQNPENWTPSFFEGVFQSVSGVPTQLKRILGKEHLKITPVIENSVPNYIITEAASGDNLQNPTAYEIGDSVKFTIDDTKPIRNAIDLASSGNIKEIFFPAGTYFLRDSAFQNSAERNYSNLSFRGVGEGTSLKRVSSFVTSSSSPGLLNFKGSILNPIRGLRFRNLALNGNKKDTGSISSSGGGYEEYRYISEGLINISYGENISVTENRFIDAAGPGVHIEYSSSFIAKDNIFSELGRNYEISVRPIEVFETKNSIVQSNIFAFCTSSPYFFGVEFSTVNNNIIRSCGDDGVVIETSFQWSADSNLAYSDSDSLIQSVDKYNNEYSKAPIEIRRTTPLEPIYFTVTVGGESIGIIKDSIEANIFSLDASGQKDTSQLKGGFRVLQTKDQLEAGIFSLTLPGGNQDISLNGSTIPATGGFSLLDPNSNQYGYMYEITGTVILGGSGSGYSPLRISETGSYLAVELRNSSDLLSFIVFNEDSPGNDSIIIRGFESDASLTGWNESTAYQVVSIDTNTNSLLLNSIPNVTPGLSGVDFVGGELYIQRSNYHIADGNIIVH
jgi:hypothetical protein